MLRRRTTDADWKPIGWSEPADGPTRPLDDDDSRVWHAVGRRLYLGRKHLQISKREAARRAGISEALWRQLEAGGKQVGGEVILPNPRPENLYAAVRAVRQDPVPIFRAVEQEMPEDAIREVFGDRLAQKVGRLNSRDREIVEQLVDSMLRATNPAPAPADPFERSHRGRGTQEPGRPGSDSSLSS